MKNNLLYPNLKEHKNWVISKIIRNNCKKNPDLEIIEFTDGEKWKYKKIYSLALKAAKSLHELGIQKEDGVLVMVDSPKIFIPLWIGSAFLGAKFIAINTALRGNVLCHQIKLSSPKTIIVEKKYNTELRRIRVVRKKIKIINVDYFKKKKKLNEKLLSDNKHYDISCIMFTSGTSGPSKGVIMPNSHCVLFAIGTIENYNLKKYDRFYICLPLYHANGLFMQLLACLINNSKAIIRERFSASNWLKDIIKHKVTHTNMLGSIAAFVVAQKATHYDKKHNLKLIGSAPLPAEPEKILRKRFGVKHLIPLYGMTEVNIPLYGVIGEKGNGTCGKVYKKYFEVEIWNPETDEKMKNGEIGEIVVRPKVSFAFMQGYIGMPSESFKSYRNFWFHTGDAGIRTKTGHFIFVDRIKDCIRRRGENISSFEVEQAFLKIPEIIEAAAFAVPAKDSGMEEEVMVALLIIEGASFKYKKWIEEVKKNLADFAIPKYIRIMLDFPKTSTGKIQKHLLKKEGVTNNTWQNDN